MKNSQKKKNNEYIKRGEKWRKENELEEKRMVS